MNREDACILINSTPKYFYLLPLQMTLLRRYAPMLKWAVYFATEESEHPVVVQVAKDFDVKIISLSKSKSGFLESRLAAIRALPTTISYVLPLQEDFLLDRTPDVKWLTDALFILDTDRSVSSLRLTPCPGPHETDLPYVKEKPWKVLGPKNIYIFTYQATLWRKIDLHVYFEAVIAKVDKDFGKKISDADKKYLALTSNIGEASYGQDILKIVLPDTLHLAYPRAGKWSNAVYLCPWPYRPTAVVRGQLEPFAEELFQREGIPLEKSDQL